MRKAVLFTIIEPKVKGESPKMYWKEEVDEVQNKFPFDMQLEYLEH